MLGADPMIRISLSDLLASLSAIICQPLAHLGKTIWLWPQGMGYRHSAG
jgi:hypothetical protein